MAFDDRDVFSFDLIYPASYHPRAACSSSAPARALRTAYGFARRHAQLCWMSHMSVDHGRPDVQRTYDTLDSTTWVAIGGAYHYLPAGATHLTSYALVNFAQSWLPADAHFRLSVTAGGHTDSASVDIRQPAVDPGAGADPAVRSLVSSGPFGEKLVGNVAVQNTVALSTVSAGQIVFSQVEAYLDLVLPAGLLTPAISPHLTCVFWEVR